MSRYPSEYFLRDLYGSPVFRRQSRARSVREPVSTNFPKVLANSLDSISTRLIFGYKHNHGINWVPPKLPTLTEPTTQSYGSNNTHYVVPKVEAIFAGRTLIDKDSTPWNQVEEIAKTNWGLEQKSTSKTRNIDFWRSFEDKGQKYIQACEIKKTTGCYNKPPVFIRSTKTQLEALLDQTNPLPTQIHPSIYIVGSVDYDKTNKQWLITWWFIPVKIKSDFICFNTSNFNWNPEKTPENDGWRTTPPQP